MGQAREQTEPGELTEAERRQAKRERKGRVSPSERARGSAEDPRVRVSTKGASLKERIESRLSRIEEAVATQSERTDELVEKVDEVLNEKAETAAEKPESTAEEPAGA
jgi:hypothetical protein